LYSTVFARSFTFFSKPSLSATNAWRYVLHAATDLRLIPNHTLFAPANRLSATVANMEFPAIISIGEKAVI
jgi:hypothetical protein